MESAILEAVEGLGDPDAAMKTLKRLQGRMKGHRGPVDLTAVPASSRLLDCVVDVLNADDGNIPLKERALEVLAALALVDANVDLVFAKLRKLGDSFDRLLTTTSELDAGVARALHLHLMTILLRTVGAAFKGSDLMELATSVPIALDMLIAVFKEHNLPRPVLLAALYTLLDLTRPDSFFSEAQCTDTSAIKDLTKQYNTNVNTLVRAGLASNLFGEVFGVLQPWMSHTATMRHRFKSSSNFLAPLLEAMSVFLHFIMNLLVYSSENSAKLRKHLSVETRIVPGLILPYLQLCMDVVVATSGGGAGGGAADDSYSESDSDGDEGARKIADSSVSDPDIVKHTTIGSLCDALAVLVVATFRVKMFRQYLRADNTAGKLLAVPGLAGNLRVLSLVIKLCVNIDFLAPRKSKAAPSRDRRKPRAGSDVADVGDDVDEDAEELLEQIKTLVTGLPQAQRLALRRKLSTADASSPVNTANASHSRLAFAFDELHMAIEEASSAAGGGKPPRVPGLRVMELPTTEDASSDEEVAVLHTPRLGRSALSMLGWSGDGDTAPDGAGDGAPASPAGSPVVDSPTAGGSPPSASAPATAAGLGALRVRAPHHLAPLNGRGMVASKLVPPPERFLCALTKQLMAEPVTTPSGRVCDRQAVEEWIEDRGTDPFSHDPLAATALKPDAALASEIQVWQFQQLLGRRGL